MHCGLCPAGMHAVVVLHCLPCHLPGTRFPAPSHGEPLSCTAHVLFNAPAVHSIHALLPAIACATQVIDVEAGWLQNVITFPPEGAFIVDSGISTAGPQRTEFQFTAATLKLPAGRKLPLPPFGKGW